VIYMGSTIVSTGTRIVCDDTMTVFVHGAYNLGAVLESRETGTDSIHPGEGIEHDKGAAGANLYTLHTGKSATAYGLAEIDFGMIADCSVDYPAGDEIPGIPYHMNPGAYVRNIVCVDPTANIEPDQQLIIDPSTVGAFIPLIEEALVDPAGAGTGEAFISGATIGAAAAIFANRSPMRAAYYLTDPNAAVDIVAYITHG
jgi:hypothetical protein